MVRKSSVVYAAADRNKIVSACKPCFAFVLKHKEGGTKDFLTIIYYYIGIFLYTLVITKVYFLHIMFYRFCFS